MAFGIEIYDLMEQLESDTNNSTAEQKESQIRAIFDNTRKDIAVFRAKKDCKQEEMAVLEAESGVAATTASSSSTPTTASSSIPPSSGAVVTNTHPSESG